MIRKLKTLDTVIADILTSGIQWTEIENTITPRRCALFFLRSTFIDRCSRLELVRRSKGNRGFVKGLKDPKRGSFDIQLIMRKEIG